MMGIGHFGNFDLKDVNAVGCFWLVSFYRCEVHVKTIIKFHLFPNKDRSTTLPDQT